MLVRRLDTKRDERFLYEAFAWTKGSPERFREIDAIFACDDFFEYLGQGKRKDVLDFGVFDDELIALIRLTEVVRGSLEVSLSAKRGSNASRIARCAYELREVLFDAGFFEIFVWVYAKNRAVITLCEQAGLYRDGVRVIKGKVRNRTVEWIRLSCDKNRWNYEKQATTSTDAVSAK